MERAKSSLQAGTQQSGISSDEVVNPQHYRRLTLKQTVDAENVLLEQRKVIDFYNNKHIPGKQADFEIVSRTMVEIWRLL